MNKTVIPAMSRALFDSDLISTRLILGVAEMLWAIMLIWPGDTFSRPTYHLMSHVMREEAWALVFLLSSITQIAIVVQETFHTPFARYFAGWNAVLWAFTVVSMVFSVYPPPAAIAGEITLAAAALWIFVRPYLIMEGLARARTRRA